MADVEVTFTIKSDYVSRVLDAFDGMYPGRVVIDEFTGEETVLHTKAEWARMQVIKHVKDVVTGYEAVQAAEAARELAIEGAEEVEIV